MRVGIPLIRTEDFAPRIQHVAETQQHTPARRDLPAVQHHNQTDEGTYSLSRAFARQFSDIINPGLPTSLIRRETGYSGFQAPRPAPPLGTDSTTTQHILSEKIAKNVQNDGDDMRTPPAESQQQQPHPQATHPGQVQPIYMPINTTMPQWPGPHPWGQPSQMPSPYLAPYGCTWPPFFFSTKL